MNTDVRVSLDDYIENGRPGSDTDVVFLRIRAPFDPLCAGVCWSIAHRYFELAGIEPAGRRRGIHALRASYATALVFRGIPYPVITEALGHGDPESAKYYVRLDTRRLRSCALEVPKPSGALAMCLNDPEEGVL
jgi:integrase